MRDGKEVAFATGYDPEKGETVFQVDVAETNAETKVVMWNWNSGILGPYLA
jgi:hypothetical protein